MKKIAFQLYPILIIASMLFAVIKGHEAKAGQVRQLTLNPDQPAIVHLAFGRTTAISFSARPEKVVPGSPQAIEVNFLGKDVTIRPLSSRPGNLLVYTKTARFVILLQVSGESQYDDVVRVAPAFAKAPIRLLEDTYRVVTFSVEAKTKGGKPVVKGVPVSLLGSEQVIEGAELEETLSTYGRMSCVGCVLRHRSENFRIVCSKPIQEILCQAKGTQLVLRRVGQ